MLVWIRVGIAVIFSAIFPISAAANPFVIDDELLKSYIGVNWQELKNCKSDADCTLIIDIAGCGADTAINKNFEDKVSKYRIEIWKKIWEGMISTNRKEYERRCSLMENRFKEIHAACRNNQCAEVLPTTHLTENEASKIADETMVRHGFNLKDFYGASPPSYFEMEQEWHIDYLPKNKLSNKKEGNETVISYVVTIIDTTGVTGVTKYWKYDVK